MGVIRKETSLKEHNAQKNIQAQLVQENEALREEVTTLQLALCEVYELLLETKGG